jgi:predicted lysophospholipase L1 biosynthesis ABC-type transport system permease subunit
MDKNKQLEALKDIRTMMNRSVRFLSLSGLSGVFAGVYALIAGYLAYSRIDNKIYKISYSNEDVTYL